MHITAVLPNLAAVDGQGVVEHDDDSSRAAAAMRVLRELIPWDGYALSAWDAESGTHRHVTLTSEGYSAELQEHMNDAFVEHNPGFHLLHTRVPRALRWSDLAHDWQMKFDRTYSAEGFLIPAGFHEGATMCLRLPDGRYTGALHISWAKAKNASDEARGLIEGFQPVLARACDLLDSAQRRVNRLGADAHAVLLSRAGAITEMPGHVAGPHLLNEAFPVAVARHAAALRRRRYLWIAPEGTCHRVELIPGGGGSVIIGEQQIPWPFGLSSREAQILHWVSEGYSNPEIGERLYISPRTVSTHIEHILDKLGCQSRTQLARLAVEADLLLIGELYEGRFA
ncbi:helix-turn-helix transcriptional regulator [Saccharopolyspora pogona]|uniref:helix-turn-helix transcriptional regulator n=1 Tax=Saccharopolyspora pogona TaxID=333966 RepID=UPI0016820AE6|nr:helix-turn-helix transcriptional regulator [Saccharopolyspora pogona]